MSLVKSMNVAWWVERWSDLQPEKVAIHFEGHSITYRQLQERTDQVACSLQSLGIEKGDRVAALLDNRPEFIELFLACARLGAIFVPLNFRLTAPELDFLLSSCRPRLLVHGHRFQEVVGSLKMSGYRMPPLAAQVGGAPPDSSLDYWSETGSFYGKSPFTPGSLAPADPAEPQVVMYTSGTTGHPKGAVLSHRKTFFNCLNAEIFFKMTGDDVMLIIMPLFHSGGLFIQAAPCLYKGATLVIHSSFDPDKVLQDIAAFSVNKFLGVPYVYRQLLASNKLAQSDLSSLSVCAIGGEKVTPELLAACEKAGFPPRQIMGQTETSILLWASEEESRQRPGTVGRPVFHAEVRLMGKDGKPVPPGEVGEIVVRGPVVMKEYWRQPEETEAAIRGGWLHTGDLARMDEGGYFYLVDRSKDMYISGGENVYPAEVERVLSAHPSVSEVAVVGMTDPKWGECGCAFVVTKDGAALKEDELLCLCDGKLARFKWPKKVVFVSDMPRTPVGKVRKFKLREQAGEE